MIPSYFFYKTFTRFLSVLGPACKLYSRLSGKYMESMDQRWGVYPDAILRADFTRPRIWIHAASVGEAGVAASIVEALTQMAPEIKIILSTTTETGHDQAKKILPPSIPLIYAPLDIPCVVENSLAFIQADVLVFIETEIWPNWVWRAHQRGVKILLVNGRVSVRSIQKYSKIKSLMKETLKKFEGLCMIHDEDARRILLMGGPPEKIRVHGNAKFDGLLRKDEDRDQQAMAELYSLQEQEIVFVAGSTRQGEEELVLKAYGRMLQFHPGLKLVLAPRHVERSSAVAGLVKSFGFSFRLRSGFGSKEEDRSASVVIIDTMGELASVYGLATFCFCGGSLVPKGGQNILEAAARAKPVFYGPHMEDFKEVRELIEEAVGEAFLVKSWQELAEKALSCLENPERGRIQGAKARAAVLQKSGAARKHALEILKTCYPSLT